jgi:thiamine-monophosphate kinase
MAHSALGPGREFDLIRAFTAQDERLRSAAPSRAVVVGGGDDACVVAGSGIALSTDISVEDVHFRRTWISARDIGWRATAASLSDLAAVAARPIGILVSIAASSEDMESFVIEVMAGVSEAAAAFDAAVLGGDVSRSPGPLVLDVVVAGGVEQPVLRSGARLGDGLWVTGSLGAAAAAVLDWNAGRPPQPDAIAAFARPRPRIAEARWLAEHAPLHALIDLSDGLAGDAAHIAAASDVRIILDLDRIPIHSAAVAAAPGTQPAANTQPADARITHALRLALAGGEDYELCFAAPAGAIEIVADAFVQRFGLRLTRVGTIDAGSGVVTADALGELHPLAIAGYTHL